MRRRAMPMVIALPSSGGPARRKHHGGCHLPPAPLGGRSSSTPRGLASPSPDGSLPGACSPAGWHRGGGKANQYVLPTGCLRDCLGSLSPSPARPEDTPSFIFSPSPTPGPHLVAPAPSPAAPAPQAGQAGPPLPRATEVQAVSQLAIAQLRECFAPLAVDDCHSCSDRLKVWATALDAVVDKYRFTKMLELEAELKSMRQENNVMQKTLTRTENEKEAYRLVAEGIWSRESKLTERVAFLEQRFSSASAALEEERSTTAQVLQQLVLELTRAQEMEVRLEGERPDP